MNPNDAMKPSGWCEQTGTVWTEITTGNMIIRANGKERYLTLGEARELMEPKGDCLQNAVKRIREEIKAEVKQEIKEENRADAERRLRQACAAASRR